MNDCMMSAMMVQLARLKMYFKLLKDCVANKLCSYSCTGLELRFSLIEHWQSLISKSKVSCSYSYIASYSYRYLWKIFSKMLDHFQKWKISYHTVFALINYTMHHQIKGVM